MKTHLVLAAVAALGLSLAGAACAQVSSKGGPVMINADTWHADGKVHIQYYDGRVEVIQSDSRLRADQVKVTQAPGPDSGNNSWGDMVSIEATGNIYYVTPDETVKGDAAVYTKADDTMVITGDVILEQNKNVMVCNRLVAQIGAGQTNCDASPGGQTNGRVRVVVYPDDQSAKKAAGTPPPSQPAPASH